MKILGYFVFTLFGFAEMALAGSSGTGWPVKEGFVVTNNHVVEGYPNVTLYTISGEEIAATVFLRDIANDLALLKVWDLDKLPPAIPIKKDAAPLGANVFTIGFPHIRMLGKTPKFTAGSISSVTGYKDDPRFFQISVPVQSGNSGGPLIDEYGRAVGVVTLKLSAVTSFINTGDLTQNINYAVKGAYVEALLTGLVQREERIDELEATQGSAEDLAKRMAPSILLVLAGMSAEQFYAQKPGPSPERPKAEAPKLPENFKDDKLPTSYHSLNLGYGLEQLKSYAVSDLDSTRISEITTKLALPGPTFDEFRWGVSKAPVGHSRYNAIWYTTVFKSSEKEEYLVVHVDSTGKIINREVK